MGTVLHITLGFTEYQVPISSVFRYVEGMSCTKWGKSFMASENSLTDQEIGRSVTLLLGQNLPTLPEIAGLDFLSLPGWISSCSHVEGRFHSRNQQIVGLILEKGDETLNASTEAKALIENLALPIAYVPAGVKADEMLAVALSLLSKYCIETGLDAAQARSSAAAVREQHMELQRNFSEIEEFAYHALAPKFTRTQEFGFAAGSVELEQGGEPVRQCLPFSTHCFAALDLWLSEEAASDGQISVELKRPIGAAIAPPVKVSLEGMTPGWIRFPLTKVLAGAPEDAVIDVSYSGSGSARLGFSHPSPVPEYCASQGDIQHKYPLAIRGFRGLPGAPVPPMIQPRDPIPDDGVSRFVMAQDLWPIRMLPRFHKKLGRKLGYSEHASADFWETENAFLVHPSLEAPVAGILRGFNATGLREITAAIHLGHKQSEPVEFSLGLAPAGKVNRLSQATKYLAHWQRLEAGEHGTLAQYFSKPLSGKFDLVLATRLAEKTTNLNAWAFFRDFTFLGGSRA